MIAAELSILIGYEEIFGHQSIEVLKQHLTIGSLFAKNSTENENQEKNDMFLTTIFINVFFSSFFL